MRGYDNPKLIANLLKEATDQKMTGNDLTAMISIPAVLLGRGMLWDLQLEPDI